MSETIKVECTNPNHIRLKVTAEFTIGEWREITKRIDPITYWPLEKFVDAIRRGISVIEDRAEIRMTSEVI